MLAVWCFTLFAAVGERLAVSGKRGRESERAAGRGPAAPFYPLLLPPPVFGSLHLFIYKKSLSVVLLPKWNRRLGRPTDAVDLLHQHISVTPP